MSKNFVHLHTHSSYSFLDGFNIPKNCAKRCKELGMKAVSITDHNHLGGTLDFQRACIAEGIKPILGLEAYWTWDTSILSLSAEQRTEIAINKAKADGIIVPEVDSKGKKVKKSDIEQFIAPYEYDVRQYHIILIAINQKGWNNLVKLQSIASEVCTYNGRFLCDDEMLEKYNEGLIMQTACIGNTAANMFINGKDEIAIEQLTKWKNIFKDRFYVEIQPLNIKKQWIANTKLIDWALSNNVNIVATNDVHYTLKEDYDDHDTLLCIGTGKFKSQEDRMKYEHDFWIKSYDEMVESFENQLISMKENDYDGKGLLNTDDYMNQVLIALENTNKIADIIEDIRLGSDKPLFPDISNFIKLDPITELNQKCYRELYKFKKLNPNIDIVKYERRLAKELEIINSKGYAPYFLIVEEYINWANDNECPTGPGRGSAAGSMVTFLLGITRIIDPIEYNLLFFRFLTADRTSPPDCKCIA